jgi:hypothetical protein
MLDPIMAIFVEVYGLDVMAALYPNWSPIVAWEEVKYWVAVQVVADVFARVYTDTWPTAVGEMELTNAVSPLGAMAMVLPK